MRRTKKQKACHLTNPYPQHSKTTTIPVEIVELENNSFHLIVKVEIDGIRGDMIIDTGASVTVIDQKIFPDKAEEDSNIKMQSGSVSGQISDVHIIKAGLFKIGGRKIKNVQLAGIDLDYVNDMYHQHLQRKIIGLLGCDFCFRCKAVINYKTQELILNI